MTNSFDSDEPESNQEAIADFHRNFKGRRIEVGECLDLPEQDQRFLVVGLQFRKNKKGVYRVLLEFESECMVCSETYRFETDRRFKYLTRTCKAHRRQWRSDTRKAKPKPIKVHAPRLTPVHDAVLKSLAAHELLNDRARVESVIDRAIALLPTEPDTRDTRRQRVRRAISRLAETGDCTLAGAYFIFE
jgi:hypothetical protein